MTQMGLTQGGQGMLNYLSQSKNPFFAGLAKDLVKFSDSLSQISGNVREIDIGAHGQNIRFMISSWAARSIL